MQAIYRSKPLMRIVSMMLVVSLTLCAVGAIQQQSNAFVGTLVLGGAVLLGLGSMLLLALGITYANEDAMVEGAHTLMSAGSVNGQALEYVVDGVTYVVDTIGELLQHDAQTTGKVIYNAPANSYKFKATISDGTWQAARAWVAQTYDEGENTGIKLTSHDVNEWVNGGVILFTDFGSVICYGSVVGWGALNMTFKLVDDGTRNILEIYHGATHSNNLVYQKTDIPQISRTILESGNSVISVVGACFR